MKFAKIAWKDISSIFRNRLIRVSVVAIIIVPLLYSLLYLAAFWDPYSRLEDLPIAVVNLDKGSENDGKAVNYGDDIVKQLKDNKEVGWNFTTLKDAKEGLSGSKYYSMFVIPEDFSNKIISSKDHKPEAPEIKFVPNDKKNFLASQIGGKVELAIQQKISSNISKEFTKVTFDSMYELKDGMQQAADGSKKLYDGINTLGSSVPTMKEGITQLNDGSTALKNGIGQLKDKTSAMPSGVSQLYNGSNQITDGLGQLKASAGVPKLLDGSSQITNALGQINDKVKQGQETIVSLGLDKLDPSKVLNVENLQKVRAVIAAGKKVSNEDLSILNSLNATNVKLVQSTMADVQQLASDEGIKTIMSKPSIQLVLSQMDFSKAENQQALQTRVANATKLVNDANKLQAMLTGVQSKLPKELLGVMSSSDAMKKTFSDLRATIDNVNKLNTTINSFGTINTGAVSQALGNVASNKAQLSSLLQASAAFGKDTSAQQALQNTMNDLPNLEQSLEDIQNMQSQINADTFKQQKDGLLNGLDALVTAGKLTDSQAQPYKDYINKTAPAILKMSSMNVKPYIDNINALKKYSQLVQGLAQASAQNANNLLSLSSSLNNISAQQVQAIQGLLSNYGTLKVDLDKNLALANNIKPLLTDDNALALYGLTQTANELQGDLAKNQDNLNLINDLISSTQDPKVQALLPKLAKVKNDIDTAKPLIAQLSTPQTLAMLEKAPELANQVKGLQQDLKNNADILEIANRTLTEGNLETAQSLIASLPQLTQGIQKLYDGSTQVTGGIQTVDGAVNKLYDGSSQVAGGLGQLNGSVPTLISGVGQLYDGSVKLNDGLGQLNGKMPELSDGVTKLTDGSKELSDKLGEGSEKLNTKLKNSSEDMGAFVSEPVKVSTDAINTVKDYGSGFTPYFIPLSLWVGAIMMFFVISPKVADGMNAGSASRVLGKYFSYTFIGFLQAVLVSVVVLFLGLKPTNMIAYFGFNILLSFTFIAIIQALISLLGDAGRLLAIVLLIFNLTTCAGTFPLELVPKFFSILNPYLPFTYAISGLREAIAGSDVSVIIHSSLAMLAYLVVFITVAVLFIERGEKFVKLIEGKKEELAA
ncbi:YhgE/Pip domain-containing protein [Clostridium sp. C8-1-8]|uniref:YhgE/Pip domain-containing protein n=1 Tax=Clostridium sp. C8-1-8 TaxID=2698831 RepID=UPI0013713B36|nr:YhgE/Pip domain-containing protein [Clostridium sp. C8-1-8]